MSRHKILGGKVQLFLRGGTWFASASIDGQQLKKSTKHDSLALAKEVAEDWYLGLRGKARAGLPIREKPKKSEPTFNEIADIFEEEYELITEGQRSDKWVQGHKDRLRLHLRPFFGDKGISEVDAGEAQSYRLHRAKQSGRLPRKDKEGNYVRPVKPPARSTLHDEIGTLSLVLKTAYRHRKITGLPDLSPPYRQQKKVEHRPWFSREEYNQLYKATGQAAEDATERYKWAYEQLHDKVLILGNCGLRPDEVGPENLQHRDVKIVLDADTGEEILEISVRGKTGFGPCKSMPGAVFPYRRLLGRAKPRNEGRKKDRARFKKLIGLKEEKGTLSAKDQKRFDQLEKVFGESAALPAPEYPKPTDPVFPQAHDDLLDEILNKEDLKYDREGNARVFYSLRHTYICLRLLDGADIYQLAKNCRTSVEMIQKHYAAHLKNVVDASAINIRKARKRPVEEAELATSPIAREA